MSEDRKLHLGAFMRPVTIHAGAWRYPGAYADANFNFQHIVKFAQKLERGKFDAFFMADQLGCAQHADGCVETLCDADVIRTNDLAASAGNGYGKSRFGGHRINHL